jgi:hypothetical protein
VKASVVKNISKQKESQIHQRLSAAQSEHSISNVPNEHILGTNVKEENFDMYEFP